MSKYMKKWWVLLIPLSLLLVGCQMGKDMENTPTKQVEIMLSKYQTLDKDVLKNLDKVVAEEESFNTNQRDKYRNIMKKHYQDLTYTVKDETIDGDDATVEVEIEVIDRSLALKEAEEYRKKNEKEFNDNTGKYDPSLFMDYKIKQLEKAKERVQYTLDFKLTKKDGKWHLDTLSNTDKEKINGVYQN